MTHAEQYRNAISQYFILLESDKEDFNMAVKNGSDYNAHKTRFPIGADLHIQYIPGEEIYQNRIIVTLRPMRPSNGWRFLYNRSMHTYQQPRTWLEFRTIVFCTIDTVNRTLPTDILIPDILLKDPPANYDEENEYCDEYSDEHGSESDS